MIWLAPALIAVVLAWAGWLAAGRLMLDVGAPTDGAYLTGFYEREQGEYGVYRWSESHAQVSLPAVRAPAILEIHMVGPTGGVPITLTFGDERRSTVAVLPYPARRYRMLWSAGQPFSGDFTMAIDGPTTASGSDRRAVAVLVDSVELRALPSAGAPPPLPLVLLAVSGCLCYALTRLTGAGATAALVASVASAAILALGWGLARLWVAPYLPPATLGLAAVAGLLASFRGALRRRDRIAIDDLLALFAAGASLIPIYVWGAYGWESLLSPDTWPVLLLPLGVAMAWLRGRARSVVVGIILSACVGYAAAMIYRSLSTDFARDFHAMYRGVGGLVSGDGPLYQLDEIRATPLGETYKYPPTFALVLAPLTWLSFVPAFFVWRSISLLLLAGAAALLLRAYRAPPRSWAALGLLVLLCNMRPLTDTLYYGQVDILLLFLLTCGLLAVIRRNDIWLGVWIGLGAALKLYPAYMIGLALVRQRWRALAGACLAAGLLGALSLLAFGWPVHWTFLHDVLPATGVGTTWVENQTFNGFLNRLLSPDQVAIAPDGGGAIRLATYAWAIGVTALTAWLTRPNGGLRPDLGYGLWIVAMLLILPAAWMHYETLLLIPFFQAFVLARDEASGLRWPTAAGYGLAWMLLAQGNMWTFFDRSLHGPFWQLILSYKFYGMLLLYGTIALTGARAPALVTARNSAGRTTAEAGIIGVAPVRK